MSSLGDTEVLPLEDTLLLVLSLPAMMTLLHGSKTGRSMCYALPTGHCELECPRVILAWFQLRIPRVSRNRTDAMQSLTSGSGPVEYLAERARSARQVSQSLSVTTERIPYL
jgi:hypothetical protein